MYARVWILRAALSILAIVAAQSASAVVADTGTVTVGVQITPCGLPGSQGGGAFQTLGYSAVPGDTFGSYTPATLTGGKMVYQLSQEFGVGVCTGTGFTRFAVAGFAADPGVNWLSSLVCNGGVTLRPADSFDYFFSNGVAFWNWMGDDLPFSGGQSSACTVVHN